MLFIFYFLYHKRLKIIEKHPTRYVERRSGIFSNNYPMFFRQDQHILISITHYLVCRKTTQLLLLKPEGSYLLDEFSTVFFRDKKSRVHACQNAIPCILPFIPLPQVNIYYLSKIFSLLIFRIFKNYFIHFFSKISYKYFLFKLGQGILTKIVFCVPNISTSANSNYWMLVKH